MADINQSTQQLINILLSIASNLGSGKMVLTDDSHFGSFSSDGKIDLSIRYDPSTKPDLNLDKALASKDYSQAYTQLIHDVDPNTFQAKIEAARRSGFKIGGFTFYEKHIGSHTHPVYKALMYIPHELNEKSAAISDVIQELLENETLSDYERHSKEQAVANYIGELEAEIDAKNNDASDR